MGTELSRELLVAGVARDDYYPMPELIRVLDCQVAEAAEILHRYRLPRADAHVTHLVGHHHACAYDGRIFGRVYVLGGAGRDLAAKDGVLGVL